MPDPILTIAVIMAAAFEMCAALVCGAIAVEQVALYHRGELCTVGRRGTVPQNNAQARTGIWMCAVATLFHASATWYLW